MPAKAMNPRTGRAKLLNVRVPDTTAAAWAELAARKGTPKSTLMREALDAYLAAEEERVSA